MAYTPSEALLRWAPDPNTTYPVSLLPPEIQAAEADAAAVKSAAQAIVDQRRKSSPPPTVLHHYTNAAGLVGIAFNRELWFGDYRATNDVSEGRRARAVVQEKLASFGEPFSGLCLSLSRPIEPENQELATLVDSFDQRYIACFTEDPDHLPQWIHYGSDGHGYCVGIESAELAALTAPVPQGVMAPGSIPRTALFPVVYNEQEQQDEVRSLLRLIYDHHQKHASILQANFVAQVNFEASISGLVHWLCVQIALDYKSHHFAGEREWRCIVPRPVPAAPPKIRIRGHSLASYMPLKVAVKSIKAGPRGDLAQLESVCMHQGMGAFYGVPITKSSIPLR